MRSPVVAVPDHVQPDRIVEAFDEADLVVRDRPEQFRHELRPGRVSYQRLFHAQQQVGSFEQPHFHEGADEQLIAVDFGGSGDGGRPVQLVDVWDGDLLSPSLQVLYGVACVGGEGSSLGAMLI